MVTVTMGAASLPAGRGCWEIWPGNLASAFAGMYCADDVMRSEVVSEWARRLRDGHDSDRVQCSHPTAAARTDADLRRGGGENGKKKISCCVGADGGWWVR